jgi:hypothetical protein
MARTLARIALVPAVLLMFILAHPIKDAPSMTISGMGGSVEASDSSGAKTALSLQDRLSPGTSLVTDKEGHLLLEEEGVLRLTLYGDTQLLYRDQAGRPLPELTEGVALIESWSTTARTLSLPAFEAAFRETTILSIARSSVSTLYVLSGLVHYQGPDGSSGFIKPGWRLIATPQAILSRSRFTPDEISALVRFDELKQAGRPSGAGLAILGRGGMGEAGP